MMKKDVAILVFLTVIFSILVAAQPSNFIIFVDYNHIINNSKIAIKNYEDRFSISLDGKAVISKSEESIDKKISDIPLNIELDCKRTFKDNSLSIYELSGSIKANIESEFKGSLNGECSKSSINENSVIRINGNVIQKSGESGTLLLGQIKGVVETTNNEVKKGYFNIQYFKGSESFTKDDVIKDIISLAKEKLAMISRVFLSINGLIVKVERVDNITKEDEKSEEGIPKEAFNKYLTPLQRKDILCKYAQDNKLDFIRDLGWQCKLETKTLSTGKDIIQCNCDLG